MTETLAESLARRLREVDPDVRSAIRVEAIEECVKVVERVQDEADEWEWATDEIQARLLALKEQSNG